MDWHIDFMAIAGWTLRSLDLRYQFLYAEDVGEILKTAGIDRTPEQAVIFGIFEAAVASHYQDGSGVMYEAPYPFPIKSNGNKNPKRADLAFKDDGAGKKWGYIEIKKYTLAGKSGIAKDIDKLKALPKKCGRYIFTYRIRAGGGKSKQLHDLLIENFKGQLTILEERSFDTHTKGGITGTCEYALCRIKV